ncbi:MAG: F0F1 ATP synthase subunit B [Magnetococcales bacterium]|nr:F0F1 ATP synthase subunit B [Magnetococcales bacterium]
MISVAHAAAEEHAKSAGMPQFEPSMFEHQIVWSVISFLILLHLLKKHVLPAINDLLDARAKKIEEDLDSAKLARKQAEKSQTDLNNQLASARQMASETMDQARVDAARHREQAVEELNAELAKKKNAALLEIEAAKKKALAEVQATVVDLTMLATEKLIAKSVTKSSASSMVEEALKEIKGSDASLH